MLNESIEYQSNAVGFILDEFTKLSADEQVGTRYRDLDPPTGITDRVFLVKHQRNSSSQKHLFSIQVERPADITGLRTRMTVNLTVTAHPMASVAEMANEVLAMLSMFTTTRELQISPTLNHALAGAY